MKQNMHKIGAIIGILILGVFINFYHLDFGLPKSFRADESEIVEPAIYYTYQIRDIIKNNNFYKLIPISYVYGTFPIYLFTIEIALLSKIHNLINVSFTKYEMYLYVRIAFAFMSILIGVYSVKLYKKIFNNGLQWIWVLIFSLLNWKLIVHGHYANPDLLITLMLLISTYYLVCYYKEPTDKNLVLSSIFMGFAVGTKITALIGLPLYMYIFLSKRGYKDLIANILIIILVFILTNPFSLIFRDNFLLRINEMLFKESSIVLDSVDTNPFKYVLSLINIATPIIMAAFIVAVYKLIKSKEINKLHIFLLGQIILYVVFFSLGKRNVERWLLPILPITLLYGTYGFALVQNKLGKLKTIFTFLVLICYMYFPIPLLTQFRREVPKSEAYYWMKLNLQETNPTYVITEEGLDPMININGAEISQLPLYTSEGAQYFKPKDPSNYKYIVVSSRPLGIYKKRIIKELYPFYYESMYNFESKLLGDQFKLIKSFVLPKPNLIPLSDVFIYENLEFTGNP